MRRRKVEGGRGSSVGLRRARWSDSEERDYAALIFADHSAALAMEVYQRGHGCRLSEEREVVVMEGRGAAMNLVNLLCFALPLAARDDGEVGGGERV